MMSSMTFSRKVSIAMEKFIRAIADPFSHPPRARKQVHQFSHKSPSIVWFYGAFGEDHVAFRVKARVMETGVIILTMIDTMMMNLFAGNDTNAREKSCLVSCIISDSVGVIS